MTKLTVVLPAYNEEANVESMVARWQEMSEKIEEKNGLKLEIALINDGSQDGTKEIAAELEQKYDNFTLINHPYNMGLGGAVKTGVEYFVNHCPESQYMCLMDCDNTQDPVYVTNMIDLAVERKRDVVIASRYQNGSDVKGVSGLRLLMSEGAKTVFSILLHVPGVKDYTCGYRLYHKNILKRGIHHFGDKLVEERGFTCMVELLYKLFCCGAVFGEVPFELRYDYKKGSSKMAVLKTAVKSVSLAMQLRKIDKCSR